MAMCQAVISRIDPIDSTHARIAEQILSGSYAEEYALERLLGVVESLRVSIASGYLQNVSELIHGEIFDDFIEMADHLLDEGYKDPSAVVAGSALESHLRNLCTKSGIDATIRSGAVERPKKAEQMNSDLCAAGVYGKLDQKNVTAWLDLRNKAAHGQYASCTKEQVNLMHMGVRDFIGRCPA
ncbi:MAG: hypothetical protein NT140_06800 [Deltaproteobacteria bacterium]|nr:hypothetical protein [Deltaproteobacteria bacterium]